MFLNMVVVLVERHENLLEYVCMYVFWPLDVHVINELSVYLCKRTNVCVFSSHKCFYIEKLNLNPEKCNKTAKYQQYQCV